MNPAFVNCFAFLEPDSHDGPLGVVLPFNPDPNIYGNGYRPRGVVVASPADPYIGSMAPNHSTKILLPLLLAWGAAHAEEWVSVSKTIEDGQQIDVLVQTPMIRIEGDIRDTATKREYPLQKLPDGQSNHFVIDVWHFDCRKQMSQLIAKESQRRDGTTISMTAHRDESTWRPADTDWRQLAAEIGANARAGTPQEAAAFGQVILFAVPYSAFPELVRSFGNSLKGKVVINASNPFPQRDGEIANQVREEGAGLFDAQLLTGAFVVRAFNAVGAARMASAHEDPGKIGMPIAGDKKAIEIARGWSEKQGLNRSSSAGSTWPNTYCQERRSRASTRPTKYAASRQH